MRHKQILEKYGATNIEAYNLINNYGYTFNLNGGRYDARYWTNGVSLNKWFVHAKEGATKQNETVLKIEKELNEIGG